MKKLIPFFLILLMSALWIWIGINSTPNFINIICYYQSYNLVHTQEKPRNLKVELYLSNSNNYYTKVENITNSYLEANDNIINMKLKDIETLEDVTINEKKYFKYNYVFEINKISNEIVKLNNVNLILDYDLIDSVKIVIGSVVIGSIPYSHDESNLIDLISMEGVVNKIDGINSLSAIILKINAKKSVVLNQMELFDPTAFVAGDEVRVISEVKQNSKMDEILGYKYDYYNGNNSYIKQKIEGENIILFPIKNSRGLNSTGFKLEFTFEGNDYIFYYDNFVFFEDLLREHQEYQEYTYAFH